MNPSESDKAFVRNSIDVAAKLFLIGLLLVLSFNIIKPFVLPVVWAIIIAVAFNPMINKLTKMLGGRRKIASIGFSLTQQFASYYQTTRLTKPRSGVRADYSHWNSLSL